jgi:hypothetical protein
MWLAQAVELATLFGTEENDKILTEQKGTARYIYVSIKILTEQKRAARCMCVSIDL